MLLVILNPQSPLKSSQYNYSDTLDTNSLLEGNKDYIWMLRGYSWPCLFWWCLSQWYSEDHNVSIDHMYEKMPSLLSCLSGPGTFNLVV